MVKSNQKKTNPPTSTNRTDEIPYYGTSLDHLVVIPKQGNTVLSTPPKRAISPTNQTFRKARNPSPIYPSSTPLSLSNAHSQSTTKRSSSPIPQESKKKFDIDLKKITTPTNLESPKGSPRSPNNHDLPRSKGFETLGCESWEVVSKQDLDYRETVAAERFLRFLYGQSVDAKQKFSSITNSDSLFDSEGENTSVKFIRLEELEKLMKENLPKNEKQYIYEWLNEIPQLNIEKIPDTEIGELSIENLSNQFQTFKSVFNQTSEKIFKKWVLSHRLERIVTDLIQKYQDTKKQLEDYKTRESLLDESIRDVVKMEVQKQLRNIKTSDDTSVHTKEGLLKEIVQNEMEKITKKADIVLTEMKERNIQKRIDNSVGDAVDKILRETEEQFTFLTSSIGDIKKDVNDLKLKCKTELKSDTKPELSIQNVEKLKQYLQGKTKEFTNNMIHQLENTSNLLERCNTIEKNSDKKIKEFQSRMEKELKELRKMIDSFQLSGEQVPPNFQKQFQAMEKSLGEIIVKQLSEDEIRRALESIIKSNLMHSEDIHGLHIEIKALERKLEDNGEDCLSLKNSIISLQNFKEETIHCLEQSEMKRIDEANDLKKLSTLLDHVSSQLKDIESFDKFSRMVEEKIDTVRRSCSSDIVQIKQDVETEHETSVKNNSNLEEKFEILQNCLFQKEHMFSEMLAQTNKTIVENSKEIWESLTGKLKPLSERLSKIAEYESKNEGNKKLNDEKLFLELDKTKKFVDDQVLRIQISNEEEAKIAKELVQRVSILEGKSENFRNEISKEIQMNMKYQIDSNRCLESSISNLEHSRNDIKILVQNVERKMLEKESDCVESIKNISFRLFEIENCFNNLKHEQRNMLSNSVTCNSTIKEIISNISLQETNFQANLSTLQTDLQLSNREITEQSTKMQAFLLSLDEVKDQLETLKKNHSISENKKSTEHFLESLNERTMQHDIEISSLKNNLDNAKKQIVDEISQIKSSVGDIGSKLEDYAVGFETLDLWKQGFNDSMVAVRQKIQENLSNYDNTISTLHELTVSQQKQESLLSKLQDSDTSISLELFNSSQERKKEFEELRDNISVLKSNTYSLEQTVTSFSQLIETSKSSLRKIFDSEIKSLAIQTQNDHAILCERTLKIESNDTKQYDILFSELTTCKEDLQAFKKNLHEINSLYSDFVEDQNHQISLVREEAISTKSDIRNEFKETISNTYNILSEKMENNMAFFREKTFSQINFSEQVETILDIRLESNTLALESIQTMSQNIRDIQAYMTKVEQQFLPHIYSEINSVLEENESEFENLKTKVGLLNTFTSSISSTVDTQERSISLMDTTVLSMEEELARFKAMMKEENTIQKNLLNSILEWKNSQEQIVADISANKEQLQEDMKESYIEDLRVCLEKVNSKISFLEETMVETIEKKLCESYVDTNRRISSEEEKVKELEQNIVDIYKKIITLYGQLDMQGEASKLMENIVGIQEVLAESHKKLQDVCGDTLDEMESHAQSLINDFYRLIDQKVLSTKEVSQLSENHNTFSETDYESVVGQIQMIQAELLRQHEQENLTEMMEEII